jgi:hypothetical protein
MCCTITLVVFIVLCWVQALFSWAVVLVYSCKLCAWAFFYDCDWLFRLRAEVKCSFRWPIGKREYMLIFKGRLTRWQHPDPFEFQSLSFYLHFAPIKSDSLFIPIIAWSSSHFAALRSQEFNMIKRPFYFRARICKQEPRNRLQRFRQPGGPVRTSNRLSYRPVTLGIDSWAPRFTNSNSGIFSTATLKYSSPFCRLLVFHICFDSYCLLNPLIGLVNSDIYWCWWQALLLPHPERGLRPHGPRGLRRALATAPVKEEATKMIYKVVFSFPLPVVKMYIESG